MTRRPLAKTSLTRKRLRIQRYQTGRTTNIKIHHQHYRQENTGKLIRGKILNLKTTVDLVTQDSYDKRHKQSTIPASTRKRERNKEEPIQKIQSRDKQNYWKNTEKTTQNNNYGFCGQQNWSPQHKCPAKTVECNNCHKIGHFARVCRSKTDNGRRL